MNYRLGAYVRSITYLSKTQLTISRAGSLAQLSSRMELPMPDFLIKDLPWNGFRSTSTSSGVTLAV